MNADKYQADHGAWRKSSYTTPTGSNCVEVAPLWRKSSYSTSTGQNCVEAATSPDAIGVRDSKRPSAAHLAVSPPAWSTFLRSVTR